MLKTFSSINKEICLEVNFNTEDDIFDTIYYSKQNFLIWKNFPLNKRIDLVKNFLKIFYSKKLEIAKRLTVESSKPIKDVNFEIELFKKKADEMINIGKKSLEVKNKDNQYFVRIPLGICVILNSWNDPLQIISNVIIPCLISGNIVIFKCSNQIPSIGIILKESFDEIITNDEQDLSYIFTNLILDEINLEKLISNKDVNYIHFSGNFKRGNDILKKSLSNGLKHITLNLDGKSGAYICEDADLENAAKEISKSCFYNSGQNCCSIERVYVHKNVFDLFIHYLKKEAESIILGNPLDESVNMGPITKNSKVKIIRKMIKNSLSLGGTQILNQLYYKNAIKNENYIPPQILLEVGHHMDILNEKIYAPVMCVTSEMNDESGVKCINLCKNNIFISIWSKNIKKAQELSNEVDSRFVSINKCEYINTMDYLNKDDEYNSNYLFEYLGYNSVTKLQSIS